MLNRKSLRFKINFTVALTLLAITLVFGTVLAVYETQRRNTAIQQTILVLNDLTLQYSEQLGNEIFAGQVLAIQATIANIMKRKNLLSVTAYDEIGNLMSATEQYESYGDLLVSSDRSLHKSLSEKLTGTLATSPISILETWNAQSVLTYISPIMAYGEKVGFWQIHFSLATLERQTLEIVAIFATLILSVATLIGLLLNSILVHVVLKPVYELRNAMRQIQGNDQGLDWDTEKTSGFRRLDKMVEAFDELPGGMILPQATNNEISSLAISFQQMLLALKNAYIGIRTDALTGLNNRMKLNEALEDELNMVQRYNNTFSVILLDIDYFKKVNDSYGHLVGDEVLRIIAKLLKSSFRSTDTPGRWGGEEFLIILPRQNRIQAGRIAERLRAKIEATLFPHAGKITSSFGITEHLPEDTMESILKRVDDSLYRAKDRGRNRVEGG